MDEPTSALTLDEARRLFELVGRLQSAGTTIIYVTHFLAEALDLADTVTVLRDGRLIRTSAAADETPERLVLAMLGRTMGLTFPDKTPPPPDAPGRAVGAQPLPAAVRQRRLLRGARR